MPKLYKTHNIKVGQIWRHKYYSFLCEVVELTEGIVHATPTVSVGILRFSLKYFTEKFEPWEEYDV